MRINIFDVLITTFLIFSIPANSNVQLPDFTGRWKFEAPDAPPEASTGIMVFTADSAITIFNSGERFFSELFQTKGDSILFETQVDDGIVRVMLKMNSTSTMSGKAVWDIGETPIFLKKE